MQNLDTITLARGKLSYELTESLYENVPSYGITVTTTLFGDLETASVPHITSIKSFAEKLLYILADNTVLPSTLKEVVEEYITAEYTAA